ncbi:MAG: NAD-dependent epimerase/dehydratase family protein [bacterium]
MKTIVVTGVAGFVGSNLLTALLEKGYFVVGIDNLSQGFLRNIERSLDNPNFKFIKDDVRNINVLKQACQGADCIVHLAAFKIPRYGNALDTLFINKKGTENVLEAARINDCKVVFTSTSDVYGKGPHLPFSECSDLHLGETSIKRWSYAVSKLLDEHLCFAYQEEFNLPVTVIRYFGGYGPNQNTTWWGGPQSVFINCALKNEPMTIHGNGLQTRSFTYVSDMIDGTMRVIENEDAVGEIFNIGNDREITILDLAKMIWKMVRKNSAPKLEYISYRSFSGRYEDVLRRIPDITKARDLLGFEPKVQLEEGLPKTIAWQKKINQGEQQK